MKYIYLIEGTVSIFYPDGALISDSEIISNLKLDHRLTVKDLEEYENNVCEDNVNHYLKNHRISSLFLNKSKDLSVKASAFYTQIQLLAELPEEQEPVTDNR